MWRDQLEVVQKTRWTGQVIRDNFSNFTPLIYEGWITLTRPLIINYLRKSASNVQVKSRVASSANYFFVYFTFAEGRRLQS